jgi:hypothetical protein
VLEVFVCPGALSALVPHPAIPVILTYAREKIHARGMADYMNNGVTGKQWRANKVFGSLLSVNVYYGKEKSYDCD